MNILHFIYITILVVLTIVFATLIYNNPYVIEYNRTIEISKTCPENICPVCPICKNCEVCNITVCPVCVNCTYTNSYVMNLIKTAKRCENEDSFDLEECTWMLNRTKYRLDNCTEVLDKYEHDCEDYCDTIEYERDSFKVKFNNCTDNYNRCLDDLNHRNV